MPLRPVLGFLVLTATLPLYYLSFHFIAREDVHQAELVLGVSLCLREPLLRWVFPAALLGSDRVSIAQILDRFDGATGAQQRKAEVAQGLWVALVHR